MTTVTIKFSDNTTETMECLYCKAKDGFLQLFVQEATEKLPAVVLFYPSDRIRSARSVSAKRDILPTPEEHG